MGSYRHASDKAIGRRSIQWLFDMYEMVQRKRYNENIAHITAVEVGAYRALRQFTRKKGQGKLPSLPTYEEMVFKQQPQSPQQPAWMRKYLEVNKDRLATQKRND